MKPKVEQALEQPDAGHGGDRGRVRAHHQLRIDGRRAQQERQRQEQGHDGELAQFDTATELQ